MPNALRTAAYTDTELPALIQRMTGDEKHSESAHSTLDVLWCLYNQILNLSPETMAHPDRDRFLLSKGHGPMAYYAVLAAHGFIDEGLLDGFGAFDNPLGYHPDRNLIPAVEIASGSLGHGLPIGIGISVALAARRSAARVFVLLGDGELDEGSNHEAIAFAGRRAGMCLTVVVVDNQSAAHGWPGGIESRFSNEGWSALSVDGHDHRAICSALRRADDHRPHVVVARTLAKGG
ncbi:MAG: transketolase [Chromatiales bacterium]|jgi:transketolase|nr:transketolase [Chromatiales bacterium]